MKILCPDPERLVDYLERRLSEKERSRLEEHLSNCPTCLEYVVISKGLDKELEQPASVLLPGRVTESAARLVVEQISRPGKTIMHKIGRSIKETASGIIETLQFGPRNALQPVAVRSSTIERSNDLVRVTASFKGVETRIEIEKTEDDTILIRVQPGRSGDYGRALRITLKGEEREIASYTLKGQGVVFENLPLGRYGIYLTENDQQLGKYLFEIVDSCPDPSTCD